MHKEGRAKPAAAPAGPAAAPAPCGGRRTGRAAV